MRPFIGAHDADAVGSETRTREVVAELAHALVVAGEGKAIYNGAASNAAATLARRIAREREFLCSVPVSNDK
jgi:hypothetical protein